MKAVFVSDIHLGGLSSPAGQKLLQLMRQWLADPELTHVFWVGDIFDIWIGRHKIFIKRYQELINLVLALTQRGLAFHYFEGNHDLYLKRFWPELGVQVHEGPAEFQLGKLKVRVEHGDLYDPEDKGYLFLRWLLRTPALKLTERVLPGVLVSQIGDHSSSMSREYTTSVKSLDADSARSKLRRFAERRAVESPFDLLIAGHVHVRDEYDFEYENRKRRAVNLGSWLSQAGFYTLDESGRGIWTDLKP